MKLVKSSENRKQNRHNSSMASWPDHLPSGNQKRFITPYQTARICRRVQRSTRFQEVAASFYFILPAATSKRVPA
jgi:hypothetical protein